MSIVRLFLIGIFAFLPLVIQAGTLDEKTPAYFVDRYGPPKSSGTVTSIPAIHIKRGGVVVKGQFSSREFRQGDLHIQCVFFLPSLQLATVRFQMQHPWTKEQIEAALAAYGGKWTPVSRNGIVDSWVAPDGSMAISMLTWLDIQSKAIVDQVERILAEDDAKRKAVPKF